MLKPIFILTTECNLGCRHCLRGNVAPKHLPFEIVEKTVAGAKKYGIANLHLTGGEPFLYDNLPALFELASQENLLLTFSSNGHLLEEKAHLIGKYKKHIKLINISVESYDSSIHEQIRGQDSFKNVLKGIDFCRKHDVPFGIVTCLTKLNSSNLSAMVKFVKKQRAGCITFSTVLPCTNSLENKLVLAEPERKKILEELVRLARLASFDFFKLFYVPLYIGEPIRASNDIIMCSNMALHYFVVDIDARVHFCCFLTVYDVSPEVEKRLKIVSLEKVTFDEAVLLLEETMHQFVRGRIEDYKKGDKINTLDFSSCFYCNNKMGISA